MSEQSTNAGLRLMALIEGAKGVLVLLVGFGLFAAVHENIQAFAEELVTLCHLNPARRFPRIFLQTAASLTDPKLRVLATAALAYSMMRFVEAYALWRGWHWARWFAILSTGVYIPIELYAAFNQFTWAKLLVLVVETVVFVYLVFGLAKAGCRQIRKSWKCQTGRRGELLLAALLLCGTDCVASDAPSSPNRPWVSSTEQALLTDNAVVDTRTPETPVDPTRSYSLVELIDLAETHNPETRFAWERAREQAATYGLARSELYPTLAATALAQANRGNAFFGTSYYRQTIAEFDGVLQLSYTVFDFGARSARISAAKAEVLAANLVFNDTHRRVIYEVEEAYYQVLNSSGQLGAAEASLTNAQTVQQAAEDRLQNGLATLPDELEARSATAQAEYELQAIIGAQEVAQGKLAKALGSIPTLPVRVQPLGQLKIPDTLADTVDQALNRAFEQRPDLIQQLAEVRAANARVKEARAAYYPILKFSASGGGQGLYASQDSGPWVHRGDRVGGVGLSLSLPIFDGGARRSKLARAKADALASEAGVNAARDAIAEEVWRSYSNLRTSFRQRQSALALLSAAEQSYAAALESYNHGVRNLLDVTAAQRTLAQARSTDVLARTQVLASLAELAFKTGDSIQPTARKNRP